MKTIGKTKKKRWNVYSTYQWIDIVPIGGISADFENDHKIVTEKTTSCVFLNTYYYGLDLFTSNHIQQLKEWKSILPLRKDLGIVININSIGDKYRIGVCKFE